MIKWKNYTEKPYQIAMKVSAITLAVLGYYNQILDYGNIPVGIAMFSAAAILAGEKYVKRIKYLGNYFRF